MVGLGCHRQVAALPWRLGEDGIEVMLVTSRDTGRWILPKGWRELGEQPWQAAAREAAEEAGISGEISSARAGRYFYDKVRRSSGETLHCEVLVYPLQVAELADKWPEKKKRQRRWFKPAEAARCVSETELAELLAGFDPMPHRSFAKAEAPQAAR